MDLNSLLKEFGQQVGINEIGLDENNMCRLIFDEELVVDLELIPEDNSFFLHAVVGRIPPEGKERVYEMILEANLFGRQTADASFGLDLNQQEILLFRKLSLEHLEYQEFEKALEDFVNTLEYWKEKLESFRLAPSEEDGRDIDFTGGSIIRA